MAKHQDIKLNKALGQHFLTDQEVLRKIYKVILSESDGLPLLEVGPGAGALTTYLKDLEEYKLIEYDKRWADHLRETFPELEHKVVNADFLQIKIENLFTKPFAVVGNFPYNISSQIVFKILDNKEEVPLMIGMFQKEMARRICALGGNKEYGVISALTQLYYETSYLFDVPQNAFNPPPKVISGVMLMRRRQNDFSVNPSFFKAVVKAAFSQRRKTLRNSLKQFLKDEALRSLPIFDKRPEHLSTEAFVNLSNILESKQ